MRPLPRIVLCLLTASGCLGCGEEPRSHASLSLARMPESIASVEGDVRRLAVLQEVQVDAFEPVSFGAGLSVVRLPCPAVEDTVKVRAGAEELTRCREPRHIAENRGFVWLPAVEEIQAFDLRSAQGKRRRGAPGRMPFQLWLTEPGDHVAYHGLWPLPAALLRVTVRLDSSEACDLKVLVDGEPTGTVSVRGRKWRPYDIPVLLEPGHHEVRLEVGPTDGTESGDYLVSVMTLERIFPEGDLLMVATRDLPELSVRYFARTPPVETRVALLDSNATGLDFLSVGGDVSVQVRGAPTREMRLDGAMLPARGPEGDPSVLEDLAAGLHHLDFDVVPKEVILVQPLAALVQPALTEDFRLRDDPYQEGYDGQRVPAEILDRVLSRMDNGSDRRIGFWLPTESALDVDIELHPGDRLRYAAGLSQPPPRTLEEERAAWEDPRLLRMRKPSSQPRPIAPIQLRVLWRPDGGGPEVVLDEVRDLDVEGAWRDREVALGVRGRGHLRFETRGECGWNAAFADPRVVRGSDQPPRPNVLIYMIDTLRADELSCYGSSRPTSPTIDALAREGFRFDRFHAVASWTRPSVASLFTSLYPSWHGVNAAHSLAFSPVTAAEVLAQQGYSTWAIVCNPQITSPGMHFEQGFDRFVVHDAQRRTAESTSYYLNEAVLPLLEARGEEPFFLYLHSLDPHAPYGTPSSWPAPFGQDYTGQLKGVPLMPHKNLRELAEGIQAADLQYIRDVYANQVVYQDQQIRVLLDGLREQGLLDRTLVFIVSDHGEEFLEHGDWIHGQRMWDELVRVPFVLWVPPRYLQEWSLTPRVVEETVCHVDILPGLLDLLGIDDPYPRQGQSFRPLLYRPAATPWSYYGDEILTRDRDDLGSVRSGDYKLIWKRYEQRSDEVTFHLFQTARDPGETEDLAGTEPERLEELLALRDRLRGEYAEIARKVEERGYPPLRGGAPLELSENALQQLRALGYVEDQEH